MIKFLMLSFLVISSSYAMENNTLNPDVLHGEPRLNTNQITQTIKSEEDEKIPHTYKGISKKKSDQQGADLEKLALKLLNELSVLNTNLAPNNSNNTSKKNNPFYSLEIAYNSSSNISNIK